MDGDDPVKVQGELYSLLAEANDPGADMHSVIAAIRTLRGRRMKPGAEARRVRGLINRAIVQVVDQASARHFREHMQRLDNIQRELEGRRNEQVSRADPPFTIEL